MQSVDAVCFPPKIPASRLKGLKRKPRGLTPCQSLTEKVLLPLTSPFTNLRREFDFALENRLLSDQSRIF